MVDRSLCISRYELGRVRYLEAVRTRETQTLGALPSRLSPVVPEPSSPSSPRGGPSVRGEGK